ncbi:cell wall-binding repeat-containing protein [Herbiconiux liukaitaii]|uniref:cell wall-binding repeat-containing protein n=1 Tax=Herbiconiux liukaitaii TaxID=3342799 RepID=UPI0035BB73A2
MAAIAAVLVCAVVVGGGGVAAHASARTEALAPVDAGSRVVEFVLPNPNGLPSDVEAGADGSVWVASFADKTVVHLALDGSVLAVAQLTGGPTDLTSDGAGGVWVTEFASNAIAHVAADAAVTEYKLPTANSFPARIYDSGDHVFFTASSTQKLGRLTESTGAIEEFPIPGAQSPWEITGVGDQIWVSDTNADLTWSFDRGGAIIEAMPELGGFENLDLKAVSGWVSGYGATDGQIVSLSKSPGEPAWSRNFFDGATDLNGLKQNGSSVWWVDSGENSVSFRGPGTFTAPTPDGGLNGLTVSGGRWVWTVGKKSGKVLRMDAIAAAPVTRHGGADRYEMAADLARDQFGGTRHTVFIVSGQTFADALSAGPIAADLGAPILLTQRDALPDSSAREIARMAPERVIVVGGPASVSASVLSSVASMARDAEIRRIDGPDRFAVSRALVTSDLAPDGTTLYIADGAKFADALSSGPAAASVEAPLLLVRGSEAKLSAEEMMIVAKYAGTDSAVKIAGGELSVSASIASQLSGAVTTLSRFGGADRYEVSQAINRDAFRGHEVGALTFLASGASFPDALAGGPAAANRGGLLHLVRSDCVPGVTLDALAGAYEVHLLGGPASLAPTVESLTACR